MDFGIGFQAWSSASDRISGLGFRLLYLCLDFRLRLHPGIGFWFGFQGLHPRAGSTLRGIFSLVGALLGEKIIAVVAVSAGIFYSVAQQLEQQPQQQQQQQLTIY